MTSSCRPLLAAAAALLALGTPPPAGAQSNKDLAAYYALVFTPQGALPASAWGADARTARSALDVGYGHMNAGLHENVLNNFGLTFSLPTYAGRFGFSFAGVTCNGCDTYLMGRIDMEVPLLLPREAGTNAAPTYGVALLPAVGFGRSANSDNDGNSISATLGAPLSVTWGSAWRTTAFVTPGVGFGRLSDGNNGESGTRLMLGGGMRFTSAANGWGAFAGIQHVFIQNADPVLGLGVSVPLTRR